VGRYAQVVALVRLALSLGLLIALAPSALAADKASSPYQRLHDLRVRAQALQAPAAIRGQAETAAGGFSRGSGSMTLAQLGAPPPAATAETCQAAQGGQCCVQLFGATFCTPTPASGTCLQGLTCCSEAQRENGTCFSPPLAPSDLVAPPAVTTTPGVPATPTAGTCHLVQGGQCCQPTLGGADCAPVPASGTCAEGSTCCSETQRASGTCFAPPPAATAPGVPATPTAGLCQAFGGACCQTKPIASFAPSS